MNSLDNDNALIDMTGHSDITHVHRSTTTTELEIL
jgi:hypothetical protein